jgi:hypothetical protein
MYCLNLIFLYVGDDSDGAILQKILRDVLLSDNKIKQILLQRYETLGTYPAHVYDIFFQNLKTCALGFLADAVRESLFREQCAKMGNRRKCGGKNRESYCSSLLFIEAAYTG